MSALANAELAVMNLLWESGDRMTARDIREQLYPDSTKAQHGTVQRLLQRLEEKGFLERDRSIAVHFFQPLVSREAYAGQQLESLADKADIRVCGAADHPSGGAPADLRGGNSAYPFDS